MERSDVVKLAELARIDIADNEMDTIAADLSAILKYVEQIGAVAESAPEKDLSHRNIMRDDEVRHIPGSFSEDLIENAPQSEDTYVVVQKIL